jgi:hypothetical protein
VFDFGGHGKNELGSYMDLKVDAKNDVTGKYVSAVSGSGGPDAIDARSSPARSIGTLSEPMALPCCSSGNHFSFCASEPNV